MPDQPFFYFFEMQRAPEKLAPLSRDLLDLSKKTAESRIVAMRDSTLDAKPPPCPLLSFRKSLSPLLHRERVQSQGHLTASTVDLLAEGHHPKRFTSNAAFNAGLLLGFFPRCVSRAPFHGPTFRDEPAVAIPCGH
jgi:hypothetical protein